MTPRVVLVESDAHLAGSLSRALSSKGFLTDVVADAGEGVRLVELLRPALVIIDIMELPDGLGIAIGCKQVSKCSPILILTGGASAMRTRGVTSAGANAYLVKPFELSALFGMIHALLRRHSGNISVVSKDPTELVFEELYAQYRGYVHRVISHLRTAWGISGATDELLNDVFFVVWKRLTEHVLLDAGGAFRVDMRSPAIRAWLASIAANVCRTQHRSQARLASHEEIGSVAVQAATETAIESDERRIEARDQLDGELARVDERARLMIEQRHILGMEFEEIAALHAISVGRVKNVISEAFRFLRATGRRGSEKLPGQD